MFFLKQPVEDEAELKSSNPLLIRGFNAQVLMQWLHMLPNQGSLAALGAVLCGRLEVAASLARDQARATSLSARALAQLRVAGHGIMMCLQDQYSLAA